MIERGLLLSLLQNAGFLLAMLVCFDLADRRRVGRRPWVRDGVIGAALGAMAVGLMASAHVAEAGIIFDLRSVLLGLTGLFFGTRVTLVAMTMAVLFRLGQGGAAAWVGSGVIATSAAIGLAWRARRRVRLADLSPRELYAFGLLVHGAMLLWMLGLPPETAARTLRLISLPVLGVYPLVTVAVGLLLVGRRHREITQRALAESENRHRALFERSQATMLLIDPADGRIVDANPAAERFYGWSREQLRAMRINDINGMSAQETRALVEAVQRGEMQGLHLTHRRADGS